MALRQVGRVRCEGTNAICKPRECGWKVGCAMDEGSAAVLDARVGECVAKWSVGGGTGRAAASVAFQDELGETLCVAVGGDVEVYELRKAQEPIQTYALSTEEINQVVVQNRGKFLAAADDLGLVHVVDLEIQKKFKTMRGGHQNMCSTVAFRPRRSWEVVSGGMDCRLLRWDFSRGTPKGAWEMGSEAGESGKVFNPPMVHSVAVADTEDSGLSRLTAVARGDGVVGVYDLEAEATTKRLTGRSRNRNTDRQAQNSTCKMLLGQDRGGHRSAVAHVTFGHFLGRCLLASGGNDRRIVLWDLSKSESEAKVLEHNNKRKINWLCPGDKSGSCLYVCDVGDDVFVYDIQ